MDKGNRKQVVYLDLEEMKQKERFERSVATKSDAERDSLEEQYALWLDLIDR